MRVSHAHRFAWDGGLGDFSTKDLDVFESMHHAIRRGDFVFANFQQALIDGGSVEFDGGAFEQEFIGFAEKKIIPRNVLAFAGEDYGIGISGSINELPVGTSKVIFFLPKIIFPSKTTDHRPKNPSTQPSPASLSPVHHGP